MANQNTIKFKRGIKMMKISKLLKVGAFALLAASLCFVSCKDEDDTNDAFSGGKVDFDNSYYGLDYIELGRNLVELLEEANTVS